MLMRMVCQLVRWEEDQGRWLKNLGVLIYVTVERERCHTLMFGLQLVNKLVVGGVWPNIQHHTEIRKLGHEFIAGLYNSEMRFVRD